MSETDIDKGTKWESSLSAQLDAADMAIICLTPENLIAPWLLFEAGALSKKTEAASRVYTYLHKLTRSDIKYPLAMFQHTLATREDTLALLNSIRKCAKVTNPTEEGLTMVFNAIWPTLELELDKVIDLQYRLSRTTDEILDEVLELARTISKVQQEHRVSGQKTCIPNAHGGFYTVQEATTMVKLGEQALGLEMNALRADLIKRGVPPSAIATDGKSVSLSDLLRERNEVKPPS